MRTWDVPRLTRVGLTTSAARLPQLAVRGSRGEVVTVRVLILTFGTRGDVQPYVALAAGLLAAGHEVGLGTANGFRELVVGADVPFLPVGNEMLELVQAGMPTMAGPADAPA